MRVGRARRDLPSVALRRRCRSPDLHPRHDRLGDGRGTASKTIAKQPTACNANASSTSCAACSRSALGLEAAEAVAVCGVSPTWPMTGMPERTIARARSTEGRRARASQRRRPHSLTKRWALRTASSLRSRTTRTACRDEHRRLSPPPHRAGEDDHLVHADGVVASGRGPPSPPCRPTRTTSTPASSAISAEGSRRR